MNVHDYTSRSENEENDSSVNNNYIDLQDKDLILAVKQHPCLYNKKKTVI